MARGGVSCNPPNLLFNQYRTKRYIFIKFGHGDVPCIDKKQMAPSAGIQKTRPHSVVSVSLLFQPQPALSRRIFAYVIRTRQKSRMAAVPGDGRRPDVAGCAAVRGAVAYLGDSAASVCTAPVCSISPVASLTWRLCFDWQSTCTTHVTRQSPTCKRFR